MLTWNDLQAHVRRHYRLQRDEPQWFILGWQIEDAQAGLSQAVVQGVHVQPLQVGERSFISMRAEVCSERALSQRAALMHSARLVVGALVLHSNHYVLRQVMPLAALDLGDFDYALQYMAKEAAGIRQRAAEIVAGSDGGSRGRAD